MITYRRMSDDDVAAGLSLCRSAGWNQVADDWKLFLKSNRDGCRVAIDENNQVVGTVTTLSYQNNFSWIGMVLVDPSHRRTGIGTKLLHEALQILKGEETIKLDATPSGREVYLQLGFVDEYPLRRMCCNAVKHEILYHPKAFSMYEDDLPLIKSVDDKVFGADRMKVLNHFFERTPHLAYVIKTNNQLVGYCLGRVGHNYAHIGPVVADSVDHAISVVSTVLQKIQTPVIIDIPDHSERWNKWISSIGFTEQRTFMRMFRGSNKFPGVTENQFAITGPEFG